MFGIYFNRYDRELELYKIFPDENKRKIAILYERNNFVHIDVRANNFKYVMDLENEFDFWSQNMVGVEVRSLNEPKYM